MGYNSCRACRKRLTLNLSLEPYTETTPGTLRTRTTTVPDAGDTGRDSGRDTWSTKDAVS